MIRYSSTVTTSGFVYGKHSFEGYSDNGIVEIIRNVKPCPYVLLAVRRDVVGAALVVTAEGCTLVPHGDGLVVRF